MLAITRRIQQSIYVTCPTTGTEIQIVLIKHKNATSIIGIKAPLDFKIEREEVREKRLQEEACETN